MRRSCGASVVVMMGAGGRLLIPATHSSTCSARSAEIGCSSCPRPTVTREEKNPPRGAKLRDLFVDGGQIVNGVGAHQRVDLKRQVNDPRDARGFERPLVGAVDAAIASWRSAFEPSRLSEIASTPAVASASSASCVSSGVALGATDT